MWTQAFSWLDQSLFYVPAGEKNLIEDEFCFLERSVSFFFFGFSEYKIDFYLNFARWKLSYDPDFLLIPNPGESRFHLYPPSDLLLSVLILLISFGAKSEFFAFFFNVLVYELDGKGSGGYYFQLFPAPVACLIL